MMRRSRLPMAMILLGSAVVASSGCAIESVAVGGAAPNNGAGFTTNKLDILFVVDNSSRMDPEQRELAIAAKRMLEVLEPQCIENGTALGKVPEDGRCPRGSRQFAPLDIHVGVITSSLGGRGSSTCTDDPAFHNDDHRELVHRVPPRESLSFLQPEGFLAAPGGPALAIDVEKIIRGVGQDGCGIEAPLEALYQFLNAVDPYESVVNDAGRAAYASRSYPILAQRSAFLRPDSAVLVVILSDEDDASVSPWSVSGSGWAFLANDFPTSTSVPPSVANSPGRRRADKTFLGGTTAPRGSTACLSDTASRFCTSCAFRYGCESVLEDEICKSLEEDPRCLDNGGYCRQEEDNLNVRFHLMKSRYGVEPRFPVSRYVHGLTDALIADRARDTDAQGNYIEPTAATAICTNPLFAATLPASGSMQEFCTLPRGPRPQDAVQVVVLTGVSASLLPQKGTPTAAQFRKMIGDDPEKENLNGIDPHMLPSIVPRPGLTTSPSNPDPVHFRDWDTSFADLQLACAWELAEPTAATFDSRGHCQGSTASPLCGDNLITGAGATPGIRHVTLAKALGGRATLGSICGATRKATEAGDRDYVRHLRVAQDKLWRFIQP